MHFTVWDILLIVVVTAQSAGVAYLHAPRWKALLISVPIPFSLATLALGRPINVTHVTGLLALMGYTVAVYGLHVRLRLPIVAAIAASALAYCATAAALARWLPVTATAFWIAWGVVAGTALLAHLATSPKAEAGHRSPMHPALKIPIIVAVVTALVLMKQTLQGFMTVFPMVGVITSYEARRCLWTITRQIPVFVIAFLPMLAVIRLTQDRLGPVPALAVGWGVFAAAFAPFVWRMFAANGARQED